MKTSYSLFAIAALVLGCSSSTTVDGQDNETGGSPGLIGEAGSGGEIFVPDGTGGADTQTGGSGSQNTGGMDAAGGAGDTGGTGTGTCVPKTCLTIAVELAGGQTDPVPEACGLVDDGCGNLIDCGGCKEGGCGLGIPEPNGISGDVSITTGTPNLCSGGCVPYGQCTSTIGDGAIWYCSETLSPHPECESTFDAFEGIDSWCCAFTIDM